MSKYAGKKAVVIGGTHGIGQTIAKGLLAAGAEVLVTGYNEKNIDAAKAVLGANAHVVRSDTSDLGAIDLLGKTVEEKLGQFDYLFLNAGTAILEPFSLVTEETFDKQFNINVKGAFFTTQRLAPLMREGGGIVYTSSVADEGGTPGMSVFSASKAAGISLTKVFASELLPQKIRVNAVSPGFTDTPSMGVPGLSDDEKKGFSDLGDAITPMRRHASMEEVAGAAIYLAADATYTTGAKLPVDGGLGAGLSYPEE